MRSLDPRTHWCPRNPLGLRTLRLENRVTPMTHGVYYRHMTLSLRPTGRFVTERRRSKGSPYFSIICAPNLTRVFNVPNVPSLTCFPSESNSMPNINTRTCDELLFPHSDLARVGDEFVGRQGVRVMDGSCNARSCDFSNMWSRETRSTRILVREKITQDHTLI
jgi:hypothetical protein